MSTSLEAARPSDEFVSTLDRVTEVYKYLESYPLSSSNVLGESNHPRACEDSALSAFAQLGTLKLSAGHCLISLLDGKRQFILAEATQSLSLRSEEVHALNDGLFAGCTSIDQAASPCKHTVQLHSKFPGPSQQDSEPLNTLVILDLAQDIRSMDDHVVTHPPNLRFYAGVPLCIPHTNINVGTYCVVDDKPRSSLHPEQLIFLKDMSVTVMAHLELSRAKLQQQRTEKMVRGFGAFAERHGSLEQWRQGFEAHDHPQEEYPPAEAVTPKDTRPANDTEESREAHPEIGISHKAANEKLCKDDNVFARSSDIIREAADLDGVVFLNASHLGAFNASAGSPSYHGANTNSASIPMSEDDQSPCSSDFELYCEVLGYASKTQSSAMQYDPSLSHINLDLGLLRSLIRRYPDGKIFNMGAKVSKIEHGRTSDGTEAEADADPEPTNARSHFARRARSYEMIAMKECFPHASSILFCPLGKLQKGRWNCAILAYTQNPLRLLGVETELSFVSAFGNSIMSEVARQDIMRADKAKADFISSISHELRSPLHGIIGSLGFLQETNLDSFQKSMTHTIETCGRTLLDTINHLLDFAKINNFTRSTVHEGTRKGNRDELKFQAGAALGLNSNLDLGILVEDVVRSVLAGHRYYTATTDNGRDISHLSCTDSAKGHLHKVNDVSVILDIDYIASLVFHTQSGALRRILANLFGNALKYTDRGYIHVKLTCITESSNNEEHAAHITLVVSDSGRGISADYLSNKLFTPFAQEDTHSPGTGLGLSIVRQIVTSLGGTISLRSEKAAGTEVQVKFRLAPARLATDDDEQSQRQDVNNLRKLTAGWSVSFIGLGETSSQVTSDRNHESPSDQAILLMQSSIIRVCKEWYGMSVNETWAHDDQPTLFFTTMKGIDRLREEVRTARGERPTPTIVLCNDAAAVSAFTTASVHSNGTELEEAVAEPLGPQELARVLSSILQRVKELTNHEDKHHSVGFPTSMRPSTPTSGVGVRSNLMVGPRTPKRPIVPRHHTAPTSDVSTVVDIVPQDGERTSAPPTASTSPSASTQQSTLNILLVDDNKINIQLLVTFMEKQKHRYVTAMDGREAVDVFADTTENHRGRFDYILMDICMPTLDGISATHEIRKLEKERGLEPAFVIAMTGLADEVARKNAFGAGVDLFLSKPVRLKYLKELLDRGAGL